jgi:hypothetical protein
MSRGRGEVVGLRRQRLARARQGRLDQRVAIRRSAAGVAEVDGDRHRTRAQAGVQRDGEVGAGRERDRHTRARGHAQLARAGAGEASSSR